MLIIILVLYVESLQQKFTQKLHTSKKVWAPWRWLMAEAETYRSNKS